MAVAYVAFLASLAFEPVQNAFIYLHHLRIPVGVDFSRPESVGFAPGKVRPFNLTTSDGVRLGAWHVLPRDLYEEAIEQYGVPEDSQLPEAVFDAALKSPTHPTVVYNHGNAATRAAGNRVRVARHMSDMNANFVIYDYRGFADSSRSPPPSEEGLLTDSRRAFDYVYKDKGVPASRIVVMGQSLGTGVSAGTVARLAEEGESRDRRRIQHDGQVVGQPSLTVLAVPTGIHPRALILVAPFSSVASLLETYKLGNYIPILSPLQRFPRLLEGLLRLLRTRFDTRSVIEVRGRGSWFAAGWLCA